jgi:hypothetical protein
MEPLLPLSNEWEGPYTLPNLVILEPKHAAWWHDRLGITVISAIAMLRTGEAIHLSVASSAGRAAPPTRANNEQVSYALNLFNAPAAIVEVTPLDKPNDVARHFFYAT